MSKKLRAYQPTTSLEKAFIQHVRNTKYTKLTVDNTWRWWPAFEKLVQTASQALLNEWRKEACAGRFYMFSNGASKCVHKFLLHPQQTPDQVKQAYELHEKITQQRTKDKAQLPAGWKPVDPVLAAKVEAIAKSLPLTPETAALFQAKMFHLTDPEHPVFEFLKLLMPSSAKLYVTLGAYKKQESQHGTFGSDNWESMPLFIAECLKYDADTFSFVIRRFEELKHAKTKRPYKTIIGVFITPTAIKCLASEEMKICHRTDKNQKPIPSDQWEEDLIFGDIKDLFPQCQLEVQESTQN